MAAALKLRYLDTGAMYRALTWWLLEQRVNLNHTTEVAALAPHVPLELDLDPSAPAVRVAGKPVDALIREPFVSAAVSTVATNLAVRRELVRRQQEIAAYGGIVLEGRDTTTVVTPHAQVRVLITASEEARLSRRAREVRGSDDPTAVEATRDEVLRRDLQDATVAQFLDAPEGVTVIDTSELSRDEVVTAVLDLVAERTGVRP